MTTFDSRMGEIIFEFNDADSVDEQDRILAGARRAGYTFQELGDMVCLTRERVRQRVARVPETALLPEFPDSDRKIMRAEKQAEEVRKRASQKRILGLRVTSPVMQVPVAVLNEIERLRQLVTTVRGWTPLDDPARLAVEPYGDLLFSTMKTYKIPQSHLEQVFGIGKTTFTAWLKNHGYLPKSPSQQAYQGVYVAQGAHRRNRGSKLVPGSECVNGHLLTEENIGLARGKAPQKYCRDCRREQGRRRYQRKKLLGEQARVYRAVA